MRHRYVHLDPELLRSLLADLDLRRLFNQVLLAASGDVAAAMEWLREMQERGLIDDELDLAAFLASLEDESLLERDAEGGLRLSAGGERRLRASAFEEVFSGLKKAGPGYHPVTAAGEGLDPQPETRPWRFGDDLQHLDPLRSFHNTMKRTHGDLEGLSEEDLEVRETEQLTSCATVVAIDISHSMVLYGEDRITPAKTVALALTELITTKYPKDDIQVILFGDRAEQVPLSRIPYVEAGPFHTNTREALQLARGLLARRKHPNKQIFLITDGKPSAITEGGRVYKNPFGLDLKIVNLTLEEAEQCRRQRVVITTFMLATDPLLTEFVEQLTQVNRGRAYFASPYNLGEFIFADYIRNRRKRVH
jgi:uncharacterized protein with von Willebrand factor type A (vWA) domain